MTKQPSTPNRSVALATFFMVVAVGAFGAALYFLNGVEYLQSILLTSLNGASTTASSTPAPAVKQLNVPDGMPQDFALRVWQEQVDSQVMITRLIEGDLKTLKFGTVTKNKNAARIKITAETVDGTKATGELELRRFGSNWYVARVTLSPRVVNPPTPTPLPSLEEVDVSMLNTIIDQNRQSQQVLREYVDGTVRSIKVVEIVPGVASATLRLEMTETHSTAYANLVAIRQDFAGEDVWMLARFTKTSEKSEKK